MQAYTVLKEQTGTRDPFRLFHQLMGASKDGVLLESKDGNGTNNVASMLFLQNAMRVSAFGHLVVFEPLTDNGKRALRQAEPALSSLATAQKSDDRLTLTFTPMDGDGDDLTRIKATYPMDVLRLLSRGWNLGTDERHKRLVLPGVFSYDHLEHFEQLPAAASDDLNFPDFVFYLPEVTVTVDHEHDAIRVCIHGYGATSYDDQFHEDVTRATQLMETIFNTPVTRTDAPLHQSAHQVMGNVAVDLSDEAYAQKISLLKEHIVAGDVFQIVPSRTFSAPCKDAMRAYQALRQLNPSPYLFVMRHPRFTLFGSSPEVSVKVTGTPKKMYICPIAGTRRRGFTDNGTLDLDLDGRLEAELKLNEKELAEHMMLVDLARNDVARVSKPGTRYVPDLLKVERYSHVMHLESVVSGELKDDLDCLHAYLASANMGTLVGSPKIEAATLLRKHEVDKRGPYGGAIGYITSDGEMDTAIIIRSAVVVDEVARVRAGAGVVFDSDPMAEAHETRAKASAVLRAIAQGQNEEGMAK